MSAAAEGGPAPLEVIGLSHSYGNRLALRDVSFRLEPATFTVLLGLNGAGKSTLFSLVTRLFNAQTGRIRIFGHDLLSRPGQALQKLGVVFQSRTLDLDLSVKQNLLYHAALHGIGPKAAGRAAEAALHSAGLDGRGKDKARNLSGGQMRRLEIARALLHRPSLLLLDEATAGLDIRARADIAQLVRGLIQSSRLCVFWATHLIDEVSEHDNVIVLHRGCILAKGQARDLVTRTNTQGLGEAFTALTQAFDAEQEDRP